MSNLRPCPGKYRVNDNRTWYVPLGKTTGECTICEECFSKFNLVRSDYTGHYGLTDCNCDYPKDMSMYAVTKDYFQVTIVDAKTYKVYE